MYDMPARERHAPQADAVGIDIGMAAQGRNRVSPILTLTRHRYELARRTIAQPESTIIKDQSVKPCLGKGFGIGSQTGVNRAAKAMRQHNACAVAIGRCRLIKTCMAIRAAGFKRDFLKHQPI